MLRPSGARRRSKRTNVQPKCSLVIPALTVPALRLQTHCPFPQEMERWNGTADFELLFAGTRSNQGVITAGGGGVQSRAIARENKQRDAQSCGRNSKKKRRKAWRGASPWNQQVLRGYRNG